MPTLDWLKKEFNYGYDSGDILSRFPDKIRRKEELICGASYRQVFLDAAAPYIQPDSKVMELGPGKGSWTRAFLKHLPQGEIHTVDFQNLDKFLEPQRYTGRLKTVQVQDNSFEELPDLTFDFFWSFGVLCHNNQENIEAVLTNALKKMKRGAKAVHQFGDWNKLENFGWEKSGVPLEFRNKPDSEIWWPRNTTAEMATIAQKAGWKVLVPDLELVKRDGLILLEA